MSEEVQTPEQPETAEQSATPEQPVSWVNDDGSLNRDAFGEVKDHSIFDKYGNIEEFVKGSINQNKLIGQKVDEWLESDDADIVKQRMKLSGVPDSYEDYEIRYPETFEDLPEESRQSLADYMKETAQWAHENGAPKELFEKFAERDLAKTLEIYSKQQQEAKEQHEKAESALKKEWGSEYDNNASRAENMAKMLGMEGLVPVLKSNPEMLKQFHDGAKKLMSDDTIVEGGKTETLNTVKDQIADLNSRMMSYQGSTNDAEYQRLVEKMSSLQGQLPKTSEDFPVFS